eukprot:s598_g3.t1
MVSRHRCALASLIRRRCQGRYLSGTAVEEVHTSPASRPKLVMAPRTRPEKGGDARVSRRMPWIFRNEAVNVDELRASGREALLVNVENSEGRELGIAMCNLSKGGSTGVNILGRMLTDNVAVDVNVQFFIARVRAALEHRQRVLPGKSSYRLLNAEGDHLPGVLCDRYGDVLCVQFTALAAERLFCEDILDSLEAVISPSAVVLRYDARADRTLEQASIRKPELARGDLPGPVECKDESGFVFAADLLAEGWTSGSFFEAQTLRGLLASALSALEKGSPTTSAHQRHKASAQQPGRRTPQVLSLFGESSGVFCAAQGALSSCFVPAWGSPEVAKEALEMLAARNGCSDKVTVSSLSKEPSLSELGGESSRCKFDIVSLEPPPLAPTYGSVEEGARLYTAWTALAASATKPGGLLVISCRSRTMSAVRLMRCINLAVWSVGLRARLVHRSAHAGLDNPIHFALQDTNQLQTVGLRILQGAGAGTARAEEL